MNKDRQIVLKGGKVLDKICPANKDYCWECGHVNDPQTFQTNNCCPNPTCPNPRNWNDNDGWEKLQRLKIL